MVTSCIGPSPSLRPFSLGGEPIWNDPGGTTTISGQWAHSLNVIPGCKLPPGTTTPGAIVDATFTGGAGSFLSEARNQIRPSISAFCPAAVGAHSRTKAIMMIEGRCTLSRLPVQKCPEFMMASYSVPCNRAERVLYTERRKCSLVRDHPSTDDPSPECRLAARRVIVEGHFSQHLTRPRDADHHLIVLLLLCDFHPAALDDDGVAWGGAVVEQPFALRRYCGRKRGVSRLPWLLLPVGHQVALISARAYPSEPGLTTCWVCGCHRRNVRLMFRHAQPLEVRPPDVPRRLRGALSR